MVVIKGFPGRSRVTVGELAERLLILHHSAVGLVDRLAAQGFVEREVAEEDRRQVYVSLTPQGEQVLDQLAVYHQEELRRIGTNLAQSIEDLIKEEPELAASIEEKARD
jgi:DNA-binding MarR family transcriptional regulator